jgi:2-polyprenyl-6-methoxyphenol hydroxylase-like FAD-dependent oxidoreductase
MSKWGPVLEQATKESALLKKMTLFNSKGELMLNSPLPMDFNGFPILFPLRGYAQKTMYEYAVSLGIKFRLGARVTSFFEEDDGAGVYIKDECLKADGVIAADGIHSAGRRYIKGHKEHPRTSGFAVYRSSFPLEVLARDPRTRHFLDVKEDLYHVWIGQDVHAILLINVSMQNVVVFCTHKVS